MLKSFRARSSILLLVLGLFIIALVATGFGSGGNGIGDLGNSPDTLATIGSETITEQDLTRRVNRELRAAQRDQADLDMARFIRMGALENLLDQEIIDRAQIAFAVKEGMAASKRMVDGEIAGEPAFQNAAGAFDQNAFRAALGQIGVSEADLRRDVQLSLLRRQMLLPIMQGARMPTNVLAYYARLLLEVRTGAVGAVPNRAVGPGAEPTEADVAAYFKSHQAKYTIPERRVLRYALFGWTDVVNKIQATDAEIQQAYRQAAARYGPKETRDIAQLTLPDQATANSFVAKVKAGKSFAAAADEAGFAAGDIVRAEGTREEVGRKVAPEVAEAAFKAAQGATVGPVRSPLGWHVARVEKVTVSPGKPLEAVRGELATAIQQRKGVEALDDLVARIEDAIEDGASFDQVAKANGLQVVDTQPVTSAGAAPGTAYQLPVEVRPLLKTGFELNTDDDPAVETLTAGQRYAVIAVTRIIEPTVPPLAEVHDRVKTGIIAERSAERAKRITDQIVARVNAGTPIREAMAGAGVPLPPVQPVTMRRADANRAGDQLPPPVKLMFSLPKGKARAVPIPNGEGWFIVVAEAITPGDAKEVPVLAQELKQPFDNFQGDEYANQFIRSMERDLGVERNEAAIARLKRRLLGAGAQ